MHFAIGGPRMTTTWILLIICFGCGEPAARREYPSLRSCQEAVERGQFMAGTGVAVAATCGMERSA